MHNVKIRRALFSILTALAMSALAGQAMAQNPALFDEQAVADFYQGKTVRMIVGSPPGGSFDTYSRLLARHMSRYIPGNPKFIVQNMPGAGGFVAARSVYGLQPKDGTVIGHPNPQFILQRAVGHPQIDIDVGRFKWLGSPAKPLVGCAVRKDVTITLQDVIKGREVVAGAGAPGSTSYIIPATLNAALGTRFQLVTGYPGMAQIVAGFLRKEVDAYCAVHLLGPTHAPVLRGEDPVGRVMTVLGDAVPDDPIVRGVPLAETLVKNDEARWLLRIAVAPLRVSFPWAVAPEVPPERVAALRNAMARTFADSRFLAEAEKAQMDIDFTPGDEVHRTAQEILNAPPVTLAKLREIIVR